MGKSIAEKANEIRREYMKQWRVRNPAKVAEHTRRYWEKKAVEQEAKATQEESHDEN